MRITRAFQRRLPGPVLSCGFTRDFRGEEKACERSDIKFPKIPGRPGVLAKLPSAAIFDCKRTGNPSNTGR